MILLILFFIFFSKKWFSSTFQVHNFFWWGWKTIFFLWNFFLFSFFFINLSATFTTWIGWFFKSSLDKYFFDVHVWVVWLPMFTHADIQIFLLWSTDSIIFYKRRPLIYQIFLKFVHNFSKMKFFRMTSNGKYPIDYKLVMDWMNLVNPSDMICMHFLYK